MIYCIYLNPTIDKTIYFGRFETGGTNRPDKVVVDGAGKAINTAVVLKALGRDVKVLGILFKSDGAIIKDRLDSFGIGHEFFEVAAGTTRTNIKIFDRSTSVVTEINEAGPAVGADMLEDVKKKILDACTKGDVAVLTGSLPPGCPASYYKELIEALNENGVMCALDASGEALRLGVESTPHFIKPNVDELFELTGERPNSINELKAVCGRLINKGIGMIAVSMGGDGAMITDGKQSYMAKPLRVEVKSTVGAGDSMVAGIVAHMDRPINEALMAGVAAATGSITLEGTKLCTPELYEKYYALAKVEEI